MLPRHVVTARNIAHRPAINANLGQDRRLRRIRPTPPPFNTQNLEHRHAGLHRS
jgi:hypothetical protein